MRKKWLFYYDASGSNVTRDVHLCVTVFYLTITLWARDFYRVIVDEGAARINYPAL